MLDKNQNRMLAYTERIANVLPIDGADNIELVMVNSWTLVAKKGEFRKGDQCVYFEIDSKVPEKPWSEFLASRKYKIKTMKLGKFGVISQGLALPVTAFDVPIPTDDDADCTALLGVTYYDSDDASEKENSETMEKKANKKLMSVPIIRFFMKFSATRAIIQHAVRVATKLAKPEFSWPAWVIKTDEERCQNINLGRLKAIYPGKWIATEKIDGTSSTFTLKIGSLFKRDRYYICSRNRVIHPSASGKYIDISKRYEINSVLSRIAKSHGAKSYVTIQGEIYGKGVQKRTYSLQGQDIAAFNLIVDGKRYGSIEGKKILAEYGIPWVPTLGFGEIDIPDDAHTILTMADGMSVIDGKISEGIVFRSTDGMHSFKAVSNEYLLQKK